MKAQITIDGNVLSADLSRPIFIGIPLRKEANPNCYYTDPLEINPIRTGDFVGSIAEGGSLNHMQLVLAPHGNGTHTECSGHILNNGLTIDKVTSQSHHLAQVVSLQPEKDGEDSFISEEQIAGMQLRKEISALVIRSLPNGPEKLSMNYSGTNPTFISEAAMARIVERNIEHLIVDLPSVDPEVDNGALKAHKMFWSTESRRKNSTITELAFIPDEVEDDIYLLNLQALRIELDASPSNPVLYSLRAI